MWIMSYGIPFDFNMPQFVNTRASQRVVVSVHAGGLGVFGGEGAQRLSLPAASVPGMASRSSAARARGMCGDGCLGAPASGGGSRDLRVWAAWGPSQWGAGWQSLQSQRILQPPSVWGPSAQGCFPAPPRGESCPRLQGVRGFSAPRCQCLRASCRNQGGAGAVQRVGTSQSLCWWWLSGCRSAPLSGPKKRVLVGEELHGHAKNLLGGRFR